MDAPRLPTVEGIIGVTASLGRSGLRALDLGGLRQRVVGLAASNLKLSALALLTAAGLLLALIAAPVLALVFAITVGVGNGIPLDMVVAAPGPPLAAGELACPLPGAVLTQKFAPSELPGEPAMFGFTHFHTGLDLARPIDTPIRAAEPGQVVQAAGQTNSLGMLVGYGNLVRIQANGSRVDYYGHMAAFAVQRGDVVQAGQLIGLVGSTGYSTGPHLHFEVRSKGVPIDPAPYMRPC